MPRISSLLAIFCLLHLSGLAFGEVIDYSIGGNAIEVPVMPSPSVQNLRTRLIIFPTGPVSIPNALFSEEDMRIFAEKNTLQVHLINPAQKGVYLTVFDDQNTVYILKIRAAREGEAIDDTLIIKLKDADERDAKGTSTRATFRSPSDTDGATSALLHHMLGGKQLIDARMSPVVSVVRDKVVPGKIIYQDDTLSLNLVKMWQTDYVRGYQVVMTYAGKDPMKVNIQRLWFPGAIAVCPTDQLLWTPERPTADIEPGRSIMLFYIAREPQP